MPSSKNNRKRHNSNKRAQRFFSNTRLWSWETMTEGEERICHGEARAGFVWRQLTQSQVTNLIARPNNWVVVCRALCELNGEVWVEQEIRSAKNIKVNEFGDIYEALRRQVLEEVQKRHVVDVGWIVQSYGKDTRIDNENLPLLYLGEISEMRRNNWHYLEQKEAEAA